MSSLPPTGSLIPNSTLQGRYLILQPLGKGGMAAVYQAQDLRLANKFWAIKELSTSQLATPQEVQEAVQAFQREAQMLASLNHAHLPKVTDFFTEGGRYYLVMDFIQGQTLEEMLAARGQQPFPEATVLQWAEQLCDALSYLHAQSPPIIFRDLKPSNIMITAAGQVFLIDFGIARLFKPGKMTDTVPFGSTGYAPPEQYGKGQTDARSDVYALGVTLHQLLTGWDPGTQPFRLPPARQLNPAISPQVDQALQRATDLNRDARFGSIEEFRRALMPGLHPPPPGPTQSSAAPILSVMPVELDFGAVTPPAQAVRGFQVHNLGSGTLSGSVMSQVSWLSVRPSTFQGDTAIEVQADTLRLPRGQSHSAGLLVQSNGGTTTVIARVTVPARHSLVAPILLGLGVVLVATLVVAGLALVALLGGRGTPPLAPTASAGRPLPTVTTGPVIALAITASPSPSPGVTPPTRTPSPTSTPRPTATPSRAVEEQAIREVVQRWHDVKVRAIHDRRADELPLVLSSTALISETKGIDWLTENNAYWDVTLHSMQINSIDFSPDFTQATVMLTKDETGRFYKNGKYYPKTSYEHDVYRLLYRMEKIDGQWKIAWKENLDKPQ